MPSSGMLRFVAFVRTDVSEERIASIIRMTIIGELGTTLAVTSNRSTLQRNTTRYVPPTRRLLQEPHSVTYKKTAFFLVTTVKTLSYNYQNPTDLHSPKKSLLTKVYKVSLSFISCCFVTASNGGRSLSSDFLKCRRRQLPHRYIFSLSLFIKNSNLVYTNKPFVSNMSSIMECSVVSVKCQYSCFLAAAVLPSPVCSAVPWHWLYLSLLCTLSWMMPVS
jgi:hypothetical protein